MPNDKEQCSLYLNHDLIVLADHEAGKRNLSRSQFFAQAVRELISRHHASSLCEALSQRRMEK
ncbi:MAG TPA: hypothetical protein VMW42_13165 [Desulfatiglandales bacterium]|nr:hypothetical protein [Desulfatiglandales bacterium]